MEWLIMILVVIALVFLIARLRGGSPGMRSERIRLRSRHDSPSSSTTTAMVQPTASESGASRAGRFDDGRHGADGGDSGGGDGGGDGGGG